MPGSEALSACDRVNKPHAPPSMGRTLDMNWLAKGVRIVEPVTAHGNPMVGHRHDVGGLHIRPCAFPCGESWRICAEIGYERHVAAEGSERVLQLVVVRAHDRPVVLSIALDRGAYGGNICADDGRDSGRTAPHLLQFWIAALCFPQRRVTLVEAFAP